MSTSNQHSHRINPHVPEQKFSAPQERSQYHGDPDELPRMIESNGEPDSAANSKDVVPVPGSASMPSKPSTKSPSELDARKT